MERAVSEPPVRLVVSGGLRRNRLTVLLRLLLALPHLIWLLLWGLVALLAVVANWFGTLVAGESPGVLHRFLAAYVRYAIHVYAYLGLVADPYPGFFGQRGYPVDVEIAPPARQNRWTVAFRALLAIPAAMVSAALTTSGARDYGLHFGFGLFAVVAFLGWFAALVLGRIPLGLRNAGALALRYTAQLAAYELLLTDAYPYSGPMQAAAPIAAGPPAMTPPPPPETAPPPA